MLYLSRHSSCCGKMTLARACTCPFPIYPSVMMLRRTHWMEFLIYGDMSDSYFLLIHHLTGVKNSLYHAHFTAVYCVSDLSQAATFESPDHAKYDFLSLSDSFLYV